MKLLNIVKAYNAIKVLYPQRTISRAYSKKIFLMMKALTPAIEYRIEEERKIISRYPDVDPKTLSVRLDGEDEAGKEKKLEEIKKFAEELDELNNLEWNEISIEPFTIPENEEVQVSAQDMENLEGFIEFE